MASSKRQTTFAKLARERRVLEKRELKREKKEERKQAAAAEAEGAPAADVDLQPAETDLTT